MQLVNKKMSLDELRQLAKNMYGDFVKAVVDIEKEIMVVGAEMHADEEELLLKNGSERENLWGINIYPDQLKESWIEFDSMINIRPSQGNRSREVQNENVRTRIIAIVDKLLLSR